MNIRLECLKAMTMGAMPPRLDGDAITQALSAYSREPFQEALVHLMQAQPSREAMTQFAIRHPDRWTQAVGTLARLGGYHDKLEVDANITLNLSRLSDMELMQRLAETEGKLDALDAEGDTGHIAPVRKLTSPK